MINKRSFIAHVLISAGFGIVLLASTLRDILSVGTYYFWLICYSCPAIVLMGLLFSSLRFMRDEFEVKGKYLPFIINIAVLSVSLILIVIASNRDVGFQWHYPEFMEVVKLAESSSLQPDNKGIATLPQKYSNLSVTGEVYLVRDPNHTSVYFMDGREEFDGFSWGYLYESNGNPPDPKECRPWREIRPEYPNWYYCQAHPVFWNKR
jgi:hypothetical protein